MHENKTIHDYSPHALKDGNKCRNQKIKKKKKFYAIQVIRGYRILSANFRGIAIISEEYIYILV